MLVRAEAQLSSDEGLSASCSKAVRKATILYDLVVAEAPLKTYQTNAQEGPYPALAALFSSLNIEGAAPPGASDGNVERATESSAKATAFVEK